MEGWKWTRVKCEIIHETLQRYCKLFLLVETRIPVACTINKHALAAVHQSAGRTRVAGTTSTNSYGLCASHNYVGLDMVINMTVDLELV